MGCIYLVTNLRTLDQYVGKTKFTMERRRKSHEWEAWKNPRTYFHRAISRYGTDKFHWQVVFSGVADEDLDRLEKVAIRLYETKVPDGYNLTDGGDGQSGWIPSNETKKKISEANKGLQSWLGRKHSESTKRKISEANNGRKQSDCAVESMRKALTGRPKSEEHRKKLAEHCRKISRLGALAKKAVGVSAESRRKISEALVGRSKSDIHRSRISEALHKSKVFQDIVHSERYRMNMSRIKTGVKHSELSRKKISDKLKGRKRTAEHCRNISIAKRKAAYEKSFSVRPCN